MLLTQIPALNSVLESSTLEIVSKVIIVKLQLLVQLRVYLSVEMKVKFACYIMYIKVQVKVKSRVYYSEY